MARTVSPIFKLQGTICGVTYVDSITYGLHVRAPKGTYTPNVLTEALKESRDRLQRCNQLARPLFRALDEEPHGNDLWRRMVSLFFKELKAGRKITVDCLHNLECNTTYKLEELLRGGYDFVVKKEKKKLAVQVHLHGHPQINDKSPRTGYQLRVVVIFPDFEGGKVQKEVMMGPVTKYDAALKTVKLSVSMPSAKSPYLVLMGIRPLFQSKEDIRSMPDSARRVIAVG